ncbi:hypothetical protein GGR52DRAFT_545732 [Hypoxylon sp. FL1284]|nr:hypothetical protein GGR52DRAFT_545732 [Hypoxylon sp. FL1284]
MLYTTILPALLLSALALAAPPPTSPSSPVLLPRTDACKADAAAGYCTTLTWTDRTAGASDAPTTDDCQDTCSRVLSEAGDWGVDFTGKPAGWRDRMVGGTCAFTVSRTSDASASQFSFLMANADILDAVGGAVSRFAGAHGGRVKAGGTMSCGGHVVKFYVG